MEAALKNGPAMAIELHDGTIVLGKTSDLMGCSASGIINAVKTLAGIPHDVDIIDPQVIAPVQSLKTKYLGGKNPRLHSDEILIALSMGAATDENCRKALEQLPNLRGCQAHCTVMLTEVDIRIFRKLGIELTQEPITE